MNDPLPRDLTDLASHLNNLAPADPGSALMTRLRAARLSRGAPLDDHVSSIRQAARPVVDSGSHSRLLSPIGVVWLSAAAAVVVLGAWGISGAWKQPPVAAVRVESPAAAPAVVPAPATDRGSATVATAPVSPPFYLPVDSAQRLVSFQPVPVTSGPDQAPRRVYRAVIMEDVAAVNAETDSVLIFSRPREVFLAAGNTIY